ncbi:MAG: rhomboid family intramembrane serine protease, partial [Actinobacteria bacterium]|nr:rhomboid family intramembrane serine protease [Actinomycetota bacterium]
GASGMIFGLFGALAITGKRMGADYRSILTLVGINLAMPLIISNIDWRAHIGGFIGGILATLVIKPTRREYLS